jgi:PAS domain S-box-containing protein
MSTGVIDLLVEPRFSEDGKVIGVVGTALDITEQRKAANELAETVRRQSALYHLSDRLNRAQNLQEIYDAAIDAILEAIGCDRVSILLYDETEVMRFVGWRGISEGYRRKTEGHSPWTPETLNPSPIGVTDVRGSDIEGDLKATILGEGIRALCFIPLMSHGRLIGKFMIYFNEPHEFTESEQNLSLTIARQLSFGVARYRADAEIRESESRFRAVADAAPVLIWQADTNGGCTWVNKPWLDFTGKDLSETVGEGWATSIHPDDKERALGTYLQSFEERREFWMEYRMRRSDGEYRWLLDHGVPRFAADNVFVGFIGTCIDITERLDVERELRASEERYRGIVDQTVAGIAELALDNTFITVNDRFCEIAGYSPEELLGGMRKDDLIHPDDRENSLAKLDWLKATGTPYETEKRYLTKDGKVVWVNNSVSAVLDAAGKPTSVAIVVIDITVRKEAEAALRESEERFAKAFSASPLIFTLASLVDGRLVEVNDAFTAITGYERKEAIGRTTADLGLWADAADRDDELRQLHSFGQVRGHEYRFRTREGDEVIGLLSAERVEIGGEPFALTVIQDITERKRDEVNREFLLQVGETIRNSGDIKTLLEGVLELLGTHLDAERCFFGEIDLDAEAAVVNYEYRQNADASSYCGSHSLKSFSPSMRAIVEAGDLVRVDNVDTDERLGVGRQSYQLRGVGAYISAPLMRSGRLAATLWVNKSTAYHWSDWEADLVRAVAERTWLAVEKLRSEAHLRESEARFRDLANAMPQLVWTAGPDGKVDYYNSTAAKYGGLQKEDAEDEWSWRAIVHPDELDHTSETWTAAQETGFYECEHRIRMKDGSFRWHLSRASAVRDAKSEAIVKWFGTATDIHDQKTAQEAVYRAERQAAQEYKALLARIVPLAQTLGTSRDLVSIYRRLREFVSSSMPCAGFFISFYDPEQSLRIAAYAWGEDGEVDVRALPPMPLTEDGGPNAQAVFGRKPVVTNDYMSAMRARPHVVIGTGGGDPQSSLCVPMIVMNKLIGTIEVQSAIENAFTDEHVVALEMVANLSAAAIENVRIIEIEASARQAAEAANQMKDEFLSVLSHELRTPLNSMLGWIRMLRTGMLEGEHVDKAMEVIERNTRQQSGLIEDLLDVSRIISGKMRIEPQPTDLRPVVQEGIEVHRPIAMAKDIDLRFTAIGSPVIVEVDPLRIQQVVSNLVQNAIKFSSRGGSVTVSLDDLEGGGAVISVADTGVGIEPEFLPHIFERFRQADASAKRSFAGLGLGLTIVRTIVELHGGSITAHSDGAGRGTEFTVTLPGSLSLEPPAPRPIVAERPSSGLSGKHILLVDDDPDSLIPLKMFLEQAEAVAVPVQSAQEALERLKASSYDVLVSDIGMPEMDGFDLIREIRRQSDPALSALPAIAITAYASSENRRDVLNAGYHAHLSKPVDFDELLNTIRSVMNGSA